MWTRFGSTTVVLAALAAVGALWLTRASDVGAALDRVPAWALAAAVAPHSQVPSRRSRRLHPIPLAARS